MLPLLLYLMLSTRSSTGPPVKRPRLLATWLVPIIFFLLLWPAIALLQHQFDNWIHGVLYQVVREDKELSATLQSLFTIDPILMILTVIALVLTSKKEYMFLIWIVPYLLFLAILGANVRYFHFVPLVPAFCILSANLLINFSQKIKRKIVPVHYSFEHSYYWDNKHIVTSVS